MFLAMKRIRQNLYYTKNNSLHFNLINIISIHQPLPIHIPLIYFQIGRIILLIYSQFSQFSYYIIYIYIMNVNKLIAPTHFSYTIQPLIPISTNFKPTYNHSYPLYPYLQRSEYKFKVISFIHIHILPIPTHVHFTHTHIMSRPIHTHYVHTRFIPIPIHTHFNHSKPIHTHFTDTHYIPIPIIRWRINPYPYPFIPSVYIYRYFLRI